MNLKSVAKKLQNQTIFGPFESEFWPDEQIFEISLYIRVYKKSLAQKIKVGLIWVHLGQILCQISGQIGIEIIEIWKF